MDTKYLVYDLGERQVSLIWRRTFPSMIFKYKVQGFLIETSFLFDKLFVTSFYISNRLIILRRGDILLLKTLCVMFIKAILYLVNLFYISHVSPRT